MQTISRPVRYFSGLALDATQSMFVAHEIQLFLLLFTAGLLLAVFLGIVYMTGVWVKMAEKMKREGKIPRRRQFMVNFRSHAAQH
jgi:hypothetical protein